MLKAELNTFFTQVRFNLAGALANRQSFLILVVGMMLNNIAFIIIWQLFFAYFGTIGGWGAKEVLLLQGFGALVYGIYFIIAAGVQWLPRTVSEGKLDVHLLTPRDTMIRSTLNTLEVPAVGDIGFGLICLLIYSVTVNSSLAALIFLALSVIPAVIIIYSVSLSIYSLSFYFRESEGGLAYLGKSLISFGIQPSVAMGPKLRVILQTVFPAILITGVPIEWALANRWEMLPVLWIVAIGWLVLARWWFYRSVKRYESGNLI